MIRFAFLALCFARLVLTPSAIAQNQPDSNPRQKTLLRNASIEYQGLTLPFYISAVIQVLSPEEQKKIEQIGESQMDSALDSILIDRLEVHYALKDDKNKSLLVEINQLQVVSMIYDTDLNPDISLESERSLSARSWEKIVEQPLPYINERQIRSKDPTETKVAIIQSRSSSGLQYYIFSIETAAKLVHKKLSERYPNGLPSDVIRSALSLPINKSLRVSFEKAFPGTLIDPSIPITRKMLQEASKSMVVHPSIAFADENDRKTFAKFELIRNENLDLIVRRKTDGLSVVWLRHAENVDSLLANVRDGILSFDGIPREIDLHRFKQEIDFNGDALELKKVSKETAEGTKPIDIVDEINNAYPDLVKQARLRLQNQEQEQGNEKFIASERHYTETMTRIVSALRFGKSVKLLGPPLSGRSTTLQLMAELIAQGLVRGIPRTAQLRMLNLSDLEGGTQFKGALEQKLQVLFSFAQAYRPIFIVKDAHMMSGVGVSQGNPNNLAQHLKSPLAKQHLRLIAISTPIEWNNAFGADRGFQDLFRFVQHSEPRDEELAVMVDDAMKMANLPPLPPEIRSRVIDYSKRFSIIGSQPGIAVDLSKTMYEILYEEGREGQQPRLSDLQKAAVRVYHIDEAFFDRSKTLDRLSHLREHLDEIAVGQEDAKDLTVQIWKRRLTGVGSKDQINSAIFLGGPGVGKTLIAEASCKSMGYAFKRIEMNSYALPGQDSIDDFRKVVFEALQKNPFTCFVLDEIEKADLKVQEALLSMMQSGEFAVKFRDNQGNPVVHEVRATNAIFYMTSNALAELIQKGARESVGFRTASTLAGDVVLTEKIDEQKLRAELARSGRIATPLVSRTLGVQAFYNPTLEQFRSALVAKTRALLKDASELQLEFTSGKITFELENEKEFIDAMLKKYYSITIDFRAVGQTLVKELEPFLYEAVLHPDIAAAKTVSIRWDSETAEKLRKGHSCSNALKIVAR